MSALRLILFAGLIFHKVFWEIMKRKSNGWKYRKKTFQKFLPRMMKLSKIIFLLFLLFQTLFLDLFPIHGAPDSVMWTGIVLFFLGLIMAVIARTQIGRNWVDLEEVQILPDQSLVTYGLYSLIRHPIYAGDFLLVLGVELALRSWLFLLALPILIVILRQALQEEAQLSQVFSDYKDYCARTKRFIPYVI